MIRNRKNRLDASILTLARYRAISMSGAQRAVVASACASAALSANISEGLHTNTTAVLVGDALLRAV